MDDSEVLALLRAGVVVLDPSGTITRVGGGVGGVLGYEIDELVGRHAMELVAPSDRGEVAFMFSGAIDPIAEPLASPFALRVLNRDGEVEVVDCLATGIPGPDGFSWVVSLTAREQQPVSYRALDCHLAGASVVEVAQCVARELTTSDGVRIEGFVLHHPADGRLSEVLAVDPASPLLEPLIACLRHRSAPWNDVGSVAGVLPISVDLLPAPLAAAARDAGFLTVTARVASTDSSPAVAVVLFGAHDLALRGTVRLALDDAAEIVLMALTRSRAADLLRRAAERDPLTGLANRNRFATLIEDERATSGVAVLYVDLDRFKAVNDQFGHAVGDAVLIEVAERIRSASRAGDEVARLGGDEFAVLMRGVDDATALAIGARIQERIAEVLPPGPGPRYVTATLGLASTEGLGRATQRVDELVESADLAMLAGKQSGRGGITTA